MAAAAVASAGVHTPAQGVSVRVDAEWADATTGGLPGQGQSVSASTDQTGPLEAGQAFGSRYHIIRLLGAGGMGAVYQAWDAELGVAVAIKVIRPSIMADPTSGAEVERRFKRELLLARQVTHTNVVRIHDLGEIRGIKYITMSYVDGVDLATRLKREGRQSIADTLRIGRSVASGLVAAHAAGVVHRDLKPANIMIDHGGSAVIMDFGIAHSTAAAVPHSSDGTPDGLRRAVVDAAATMVGSIVGTIEYMAPEQARGQTVDQRADIYAFGLILYDTLVGCPRAQHGESAIAELQRRLVAAPPPVRTVVSDIPEPLSDLIARCVEPDAANRYQTTAELAADLARLDEEGKRIPVRRMVGLPLVAAMGVLLTGLAAGTWWYSRLPAAAPPDPVSVVIADFENRTKDTAFDQTLEPMLRRVLEEAGFISAYDLSGVRDLGVRPPQRFDEAAARQLAANQGLRVVLAGSIEPQGGAYVISARATQAVTGEVIATTQERAATREQVLPAASRLMIRVRNALGDTATDSSQQFAAGGLSTTSLEVVGLYAAASKAAASNRFEEARERMTKAVALDPEFGIGYLLLAVLSRNDGRLDDERSYLATALRHLDRMTERERYTTRGYSHWVAGDYQQCVKEYSELIAKYPAAIGGRNQLALCLSSLRNMRRALEEIQALVKIMPGQPLFRDNLALYANYAGDFQTAEREARTVERTAQRPDAYAALALAFSQLGHGRLADARQTYDRLAGMGARGASFAAAGLGDLAMLEGRFAQAVKILTRGADADAAAGQMDSAAEKLVAAAYGELSRGELPRAIAMADDALRHSSAVKIRFLAGRIFVEAGAARRAAPLIDGLARELYAEPQAYARILQGLVVLQSGDARQAMNTLREANDLFDTWIGLFDLGRASLRAGALAQADSAFDDCLNARRGEALSLFLDEEPTYAYLAHAYYYQGRVREELKTAGFADPYKQYLELRGAGNEDPLLTDVRRRIN
jgi:tetratricopeptide (TPR) repeat protein